MSGSSGAGDPRLVRMYGVADHGESVAAGFQGADGGLVRPPFASTLREGWAKIVRQEGAKG